MFADIMAISFATGAALWGRGMARKHSPPPRRQGLGHRYEVGNDNAHGCFSCAGGCGCVIDCPTSGAPAPCRAARGGPWGRVLWVVPSRIPVGAYGSHELV